MQMAMSFAKCNVECTASPKQASYAQDLLIKQLNKAGYRQSKIMPGYWQHDWRPISFTLVINDFGVKCIDKNDVKHLISILKQNYTINTD